MEKSQSLVLSDSMDVSIIIVNYNTKELTAHCIDSVYEKSEGIDFEIILVDNASSDGSREYFQNDSRITYIYNDENLGFGRANNRGLEVAKGRDILFLNSDTLLVNNAVKILVDYLRENPSVGACGGNLYDEDMQPAISYRRYFPGIREELNNLCFHLPERVFCRKMRVHNCTQQPLKVAYICGADLMIRRAVLEQVGAFSEDFFMYYEETDLCFRIHKAGYDITSVPQACIQHLEGKSFKSIFDANRLVISEKGRAVFYRRNYPSWYYRVANCIAWIALTVHPMIYRLFGYREAAGACKTRRAALRHIRKTSK